MSTAIKTPPPSSAREGAVSEKPAEAPNSAPKPDVPAGAEQAETPEKKAKRREDGTFAPQLPKLRGEDKEPVEVLPGVIEWRAPEKQKSEKKEKQAPAESKSDTKAAADAPSSQPPASKDAAAPDAAAAGEPFTFGGETFKTREEAEHKYKSLQGTYKAREQAALDAAKKAQEWADEAAVHRAEKVKLREELEALKAGKSAPNPSAAAPAPAGANPSPKAGTTEGNSASAATRAFVETLDWELMRKLSAHPEDGPWVEKAYFADSLDKHIQNVLTSKLEALRQELNPILQERQVDEQYVRARNLFQQAHDYVRRNDGQPLYPELRDKETAAKVAALWHKMWHEKGLPDEFVWSHDTLHQTILTFRDMMAAAGLNAEPAPRPTAPPANSASSHVSSMVEGLKAAERAASGTLPPSPEGGLGSMEPASDAQKAAQKITKDLSDDDDAEFFQQWGFRRRR